MWGEGWKGKRPRRPKQAATILQDLSIQANTGKVGCWAQGQANSQLNSEKKSLTNRPLVYTAVTTVQFFLKPNDLLRVWVGREKEEELKEPATQTGRCF